MFRRWILIFISLIGAGSLTVAQDQQNNSDPSLLNLQPDLSTVENRTSSDTQSPLPIDEQIPGTGVTSPELLPKTSDSIPSLLQSTNNAEELCGTTKCRKELKEICRPDQRCGCADNQVRVSPENYCQNYKDVIIPLWVLSDRSGILNYSDALADTNSKHYKDFSDQLQILVFESLKKAGFRPLGMTDVILRRPSDVNSTFSDEGLYTEFSLRLAEIDQSINELSVHDALTKELQQNGFSDANSSLRVNEFQPDVRCNRHKCDKSAWCVPNDDPKVFFHQCTCPPGCSKLDNGECWCGCRNVACQQFADCVQADTEGGYACKCKFGFTEELKLGEGPPKASCSMNRCLDRVEDCAAKNASCVQSDFQSDCKCLDGFLDIRKSPLRSGHLADKICLAAADVDECQLSIHDCQQPTVCIKTNTSLDYGCQCPDGRLVGPGVNCSREPFVCDKCGKGGMCTVENQTLLCLCDDGQIRPDCGKNRDSKQSNSSSYEEVFFIGGVEFRWSWIAFGLGIAGGVLLCCILLLIIVCARRQCKRQTPSRATTTTDDEVFDFHEVRKNVYGVVGQTSQTKPIGKPISVADCEMDRSTSPPSDTFEGPYAVSSVSTFKRNGHP